MNRQQAEHILVAYINLEYSDGDNNARAALRDVILDAMTNCAVTTPTITWPNNTYPLTVPNLIHNGPVTCDAGGAQ